MMPKRIDGAHPDAIPPAIKQLFSRKRWRWLQRLTHIRRIHHPLYSFGWAFPIGEWCYFPARIFKDDLDRDKVKTWPGHWSQCPPDTYHDCTTSGVY